MIDSNVPKFLNQDLGLFDAIIGDLFPTVDDVAFDKSELMNAIKEVIATNKL